jgi:hypothetical protein
MYCESIEHRESWLRQADDEKVALAKLDEYRTKQNTRIKDKYESGEIGAMKHSPKKTYEDLALEKSNVFEDHINAPMVVSFMYKNLDQILTVSQGLDQIMKHVQKGQGCWLLLKNGLIPCLRALAVQWKDKSDIILFVLSIIRRMLECNMTRDEIIKDTEVLAFTFQLGHRHMSSLPHLEEAVACVMHCARAELCRQYIMDKKLPVYIIQYCKRFSRAPDLARPAVKTFNWVSDHPFRMRGVLEMGCLEAVVQLIKRHASNARVLGPALHFLTRASRTDKDVLEYLLKQNMVDSIVAVTSLLYDNDALQLEALKLVQQLAKSDEGYNQITRSRGAWQSLCAGTSKGSVLVHDLPGALHNPGWTIGETKHLTVYDRAKLAAAKQHARRTRPPPKSLWTPASLKAFMGLGNKAMKLEINNEKHDAFFQLMTKLGLLPKPGEEREEWFIRLKEYEREGQVLLDDMAETMLNLQKRQVKEAKMAAEHRGEDGEHIKPLYLVGQKYDSVAQVENDQDIMAQFEEIVTTNEADVRPDNLSHTDLPEITGAF